MAYPAPLIFLLACFAFLVVWAVCGAIRWSHLMFLWLTVAFLAMSLFFQSVVYYQLKAENAHLSKQLQEKEKITEQ